MFTLYDVGIPKVRLGPAHDGGYVILDSNFNSKILMGYGVGDNVEFENSFCERYGTKAVCFDHTIDKIPRIGSGVEYVREGISAVDADPLYSLATHIARYAPDQDITLKIDVEGAEWDVLKTADLSRVTQLIIEFHDMHTAPSSIFKKLNNDFYLIHVHGTNFENQPYVYFNRVQKMPRYIECTYVRKDLVPHNNVKIDTSSYPTPLDQTGCKEKPEVTLEFLKPLSHRPISFVVEDSLQIPLLEGFLAPGDEIVSEYTMAKNSKIFLVLKGDYIVPQLILELENIKAPGNYMFPVLSNTDVRMRVRLIIDNSHATYQVNGGTVINNFIKYQNILL